MWHVGINTPVVKFILNMFVPSDGSKSCESRKRGQHFHGVCYPGQPNEQRLCFGHQSSYIPAWKATRNQILHGAVPLSFLHYPQGYQRVTTHAEWRVKTVVWIGVVSGVIMHKAFAARFMMPRRLGAKKGCLLWHCRSPCGQIHFIALRKSRVTYYNGIYLDLIPVNRSLYRPSVALWLQIITFDSGIWPILGGLENAIQPHEMLDIVITKNFMIHSDRRITSWHSDGPFRVAPRLCFKSEAKCNAIAMKRICYSPEKETHFYEKGFALSHVSKVRVFATQKWPTPSAEGLTILVQRTTRIKIIVNSILNIL